MKRPRRGYADGPYGQVHFQDTGGNGLPLILCHQAPITSRQYDNVFKETGVYAKRIFNTIEEKDLWIP